MKTDTHVVDLEISNVVVEGNFRRTFDEKKLQELTDSIKEFGVLEPIIARWHSAPGHVILIAGERRLRASKAAGLKTIPVRVLDVDAKTAAEIQLLENLHREDLGPMEEAEAFKALLDGGSHTVETLAERVDKSVAYVYRALKLVELPEEAKAMIQGGVITAAHGHQIMRAPAHQRAEIADYILKTLRVRHFPVWELKAHIDYRYSADLAHAVFPKTKPYAGEMACSGCPFNSGNQGNLFDGAEKGKCNNPECFTKKTGTFLEDYSKTQAAEYHGLQYLGIHTVTADGAVEGLKRSTVLPMVNRRETQKLMREMPDKFGWCVVSPRNPGDKPTTTVVCLDRRIMDVHQPKKPAPAKANVDSAKERKQAFINRSVEDAVQQAVRETIEPRERFGFTAAQWKIILPAVGVEWIENRTDRARAQDILWATVSKGTPADLKALGLDVDKIWEKAQDEAEDVWKRTQEEK